MLAAALALAATFPVPAMEARVAAQEAAPTNPSDDSASAAVAAAQKERDPDLNPNPAQPDFTVVNLPTTLRLPRFKGAFRVTHRFARPLGQGSFGRLLEDFFGFDTGAQIGLEYRFGLWRGGQVGIHRTSNRTIQFFAQHALLQQGDARPVGIAVLGSINGTNNFRNSYAPSLGVLLSRTLGRHGALYLEPMWVNNTNLLPSGQDDTFIAGVGARLRIRPTVYLVGEVIPRMAGYDPGVHQASFGIEKRAGGHMFQLNFSNGFGTTVAQMARGGTASDDWYIGFNISRKFF